MMVLLHLSLTFQVWSQVPENGADSLIPDAARLLSQYIRFASVTGNEREAGEFISGICRERGLHVTVFTDSADCYNFVASLYPLDLKKPNIVLLSHIDVVSGGSDTLWKHPPFSGEISEDTIWGRGTIDMKCAAIMYLVAASSFAGRASAEDLPANVSLLFVSGEEAFGMRGAKIISGSFMPELNASVIIGEGGIGTTGFISGTPDRPVFFISLNEKRALWIELELDYRSAGHGAVPPPDYAARMMVNSLHDLTFKDHPIRFNRENRALLKALGELEQGVPGFIMKHPVLFRPFVTGGLNKNPLMASAFRNTIAITHISTEFTVINQVPQNVRAFLDCRLLPETSTETFIDYISRKLNNERISVSIINETRNAPSSPPDRYYEMLTESLDETYPGCGIVPVLFPATTDNNYFRSRGVPVFGVVPVVLDRRLLETIHTYNERLPVDALLKGTDVFRRFIGKLLFADMQVPDTLMVSQ